MIEPKNPDLIGHGGGVGRYRGLPLEQIAERFAACVAEPSMRSLSAVLRITREQLDARGGLGHYPVVTMIAGVISLALLGALPFMPKELRDMVIKVSLGGPLITLILAYATWTSRKPRRAAIAQEREIRKLAVQSLEKILETPFTMKPLLREQVDTLRGLLKHYPDSSRIRQLLKN